MTIHTTIASWHGRMCIYLQYIHIVQRLVYNAHLKYLCHYNTNISRTIFVHCEAGERVTDRFYIFHHEICHLDWYIFPMKTQKMLLIILSSTQQPAVIQGYANTQCTRDAFKSVNISKKFFKKILFVYVLMFAHISHF